jgi:hypothetical protein
MNPNRAQPWTQQEQASRWARHLPPTAPAPAQVHISQRPLPPHPHALPIEDGVWHFGSKASVAAKAKRTAEQIARDAQSAAILHEFDHAEQQAKIARRAAEQAPIDALNQFVLNNWKCPYCGTRISPDYNTCPICGKGEEKDRTEPPQHFDDRMKREVAGLQQEAARMHQLNADLRAAEEELRKKEANDAEEERKRKVAAEAERRRKAEEEAERKRKAEEAERRRKAEEEEAERRRREEAERRRREEAARKAQEEAERRRKAEEEEAARKAAPAYNECAICIDSMDDGRQVVRCIQCVAWFHLECARRLTPSKCPNCRSIWGNLNHLTRRAGPVLEGALAGGKKRKNLRTYKCKNNKTESTLT